MIFDSRFFSLQLLTNGNDDNSSQSHCNATAFTTHVNTARGKSLSPPKIGAIRKQTLHSNVYFNRSPNQRHIVRPFNFLRKHKIIAKAKQQARLSPSAISPTAMGKTIARVETPPKQTTPEKTLAEKEDKANASDSEYSSLEDDDDDQGRHVKNVVAFFLSKRDTKKNNL